MDILTATLSVVEGLAGDLAAVETIQASLNVPEIITPGGTYAGPYTVTPTQETQTLQTSNMMMSDDVTINPIPSNYGLITWDGATLTVS